MHFFAKILACAVMAAAAINVASAEDWTKVRIGTEGAYPPFNYIDSNGELQGFDIEIAKALCDEMKVECEFIAQDWDGIIPALLANKYDAIIASMSITPERKQVVDFTNKYYSTPPALVAGKDSTLTETTPAALEGMTVGVQSATTHATYVEDKYTGSDVRLYPTQEEANADLASGRLDAVMADSVVLSEWLKTENSGCCKMIGAVENDPQYFGEGVGIAIRKEDTALRDKFNAAIEAIRANGTYQAINDKFFAFSVY